MCRYLTARRRTPTGVPTVTVACATATVTGAVPDESSGGNDDLELIFGGILAWILVIGLIAAIVAFCGWLFSDTTPAAAAGRSTGSPAPQGSSLAVPAPAPPFISPSSPPTPQRAASLRASAVHAQAERPRRRAKPRDVILDAVEAIADTYHARLQNILEHQDARLARCAQ